MNFKLEICVDSVESAIDAQAAGADRIELCNSLGEGGTTPGSGTIISARNNLTIGLHVIIRPRGGDFLYSDLEYDIMRREIELCGEYGVDGVVIGILEPDGRIVLNEQQSSSNQPVRCPPLFTGRLICAAILSKASRM